jgi:hypothetical protein
LALPFPSKAAVVYLPSPLAITVGDTQAVNFNVVIYQGTIPA